MDWCKINYTVNVPCEMELKNKSFLACNSEIGFLFFLAQRIDYEINYLIRMSLRTQSLIIFLSSVKIPTISMWNII